MRPRTDGKGHESDRTPRGPSRNPTEHTAVELIPPRRKLSPGTEDSLLGPKLSVEGVVAYDSWFDRQRDLYLSCLSAIGLLLDRQGTGLEIGVGTGRFAAPLGIDFGLDPCPNMLETAASRGVVACQGTATALPFDTGCLEYILLGDAIAWIAEVPAALDEIHRVLVEDGQLLVSMPNPHNSWGRSVQERAGEPASVLRSVSRTRAMLRAHGFQAGDVHQTLFGPPGQVDRIQEPREGDHDGALLLLEARSSDVPTRRND